MALPAPNENYQLSVELKEIFREVLASPLNFQHLDQPKKENGNKRGNAKNQSDPKVKLF